MHWLPSFFTFIVGQKLSFRFPDGISIETSLLFILIDLNSIHTHDCERLSFLWCWRWSQLPWITAGSSNYLIFYTQWSWGEGILFRIVGVWLCVSNSYSFCSPNSLCFKSRLKLSIWVLGAFYDIIHCFVTNYHMEVLDFIFIRKQTALSPYII